MSDSVDDEACEAHPMSTTSPETQGLARRLLAFQAAHHNSSATGVDGAARVIEELRLRLIKLAGIDGFRALLSRALTLAKAEVPSLNMVQVSADGSLEGVEGIEQSQEAGATGQVGGCDRPVSRRIGRTNIPLIA